MKLHDLRPADGSRKKRRRVGRGIAAGRGKTAGRGTKGQLSRAGGGMPAWFEGGQTPLHVRIPKLRGFKNKFKIDYEVVNLGAIGQLVELGAFEAGDHPGATAKSKAAKAAPITINQELLRAVGLVRTLNKPMKVLGTGDIAVPLFVVADAFSKTAVAKIEAAGGTVSVLEVPTAPREALGVTKDGEGTAQPAAEATSMAEAAPDDAAVAQGAASADDPGPAAAAEPAEPAKPKARRSKASAAGSAPATEPAPPEADAAAPEDAVDATEADATLDEPATGESTAEAASDDAADATEPEA